VGQRQGEEGVCGALPRPALWVQRGHLCQPVYRDGTRYGHEGCQWVSHLHARKSGLVFETIYRRVP
jgi:hypothetical protein